MGSASSSLLDNAQFCSPDKVVGDIEQFKNHIPNRKETVQSKSIATPQTLICDQYKKPIRQKTETEANKSTPFKPLPPKRLMSSPAKKASCIGTNEEANGDLKQRGRDKEYEWIINTLMTIAPNYAKKCIQMFKENMVTDDRLKDLSFEDWKALLPMIGMHSKKILSPTPKESNSHNESPDAPEMKVDPCLFGVGSDTLRLLLTLDNVNSVNDNLVPHNAFKPKKESADEYSSDSLDERVFHKTHQNKRKSYLIRDNSNGGWESDDYDDLEEEMTREHRRLSSEMSSLSFASESIAALRSSTTQHSHLLTWESADKWDADDIDEQTDEITKQILHLQSNNSTASNK